MNDPDQELYVVTEGTLTDPLRATALHEAVALYTGILRPMEQIDDDDIEEILIVAERLHNWLRAEPGA